MRVAVIDVRAPEYTVDREPDYLSIGTRVDRAIEGNFPDGRYLMRAVSVDEHPLRTVDELVRVVLATGTDKYDSRRSAVGQEEFSGYDYDIQASLVEIRNSRLVLDPQGRYPTAFGEIAWHFYHGASLDRGRPVRIDLLLLYDPTQLSRARKFHPRAKGVRKGLHRFLYKFKDPADKPGALRGVVRVLRWEDRRTSRRKAPGAVPESGPGNVAGTDVSFVSGRILVAGPSASGKSTLARYLRMRGIHAVDGDDLPGLGRPVNSKGRPLRRITKEQWRRFEGWRYSWHEPTLRRFLSRHPNVVLLGASDDMFELDLRHLFDRRIYLQAPWSVIRARLNHPTRDNDWGRDSQPAQQKWVRKAVRDWPDRARACGFEFVDASLSPARILAHIRGHSRRNGVRA